jgi:hypothetical protein
MNLQKKRFRENIRERPLSVGIRMSREENPEEKTTRMIRTGIKDIWLQEQI